jgi:hypothetical protein
MISSIYNLSYLLKLKYGGRGIVEDGEMMNCEKRSFI